MGKTNMLVLPLCSCVSWHEGCLINFTPQTFLKYEAQLANRPKSQASNLDSISNRNNSYTLFYLLNFSELMQ